MEIVHFSKKAIEEINRWAKVHGAGYNVSPEDLPRHTFMALKDGELVAIAALRLCEHPICIIDSLATNPDSSSEDRHQAIDALVVTLLDKAKELEFRVVLAWTADAGVFKRAQVLHGFCPIPEALIGKEI